MHKPAPADDKLVRLLEPGDCFGEMALIDLYPRSASIMALEDCAAIEISTSALHTLYERYLEQSALLHMNIARELSRRLRQSDQALFRCARGEAAPGAAQLLSSV